MLRRRLTALLVGLLLLPSTAIGGGSRCEMRGDASHGEHAASAHHESHPGGERVSGLPDDSGPAPLPEAPAACVVMACAGAGMVASSVVVVDAGRVVEVVIPEATLAPESAVPGLDPPPPRV